MIRRSIRLNPQKKTFDLPLLIVVITLVIFGAVLVYDASSVHAYRDFGDSYYYIRAQLIWIVLGSVAALFFANFNYLLLKKFAWPGFLTSIILLLAVFIPGFGTSAGGAHRWLSLGFITIQPAEIMKLSTVLWLATIFEKKAGLKPLLILLAIGGLLLGVLQKDLGSAVVFVAISIILYIVADGSLWQILLAIPLGVVSFAVLILTSSYRQKRILAFLDPFSDPQGFTYHISQVLIGLGSGGFLGLGLGQSRQKFYIPEVTTDSIFAIIGEEFGFIGSLVLISLFAFLIIRGLKIAQSCEDRFGRILAAGITTWLGVQAIINLGAMVALFPLTGVPLPFISYGGSALVVNLAAVGILLNISRRNVV
jgi:cell division protein FtsW